MSELEAHDKTEPTRTEKPTDDPDDEKTKQSMKNIEDKQIELQKLQTQNNEFKVERQTLTAQQATLNRLLAHLQNFEVNYKTFVEKHKSEFEDAGFDIAEIVKLQINRDELTGQAQSTAARFGELNVLIDGSQATETTPATDGLTKSIANGQLAITKLQDGLNAPQKAYQAYLAELAKWKEKRLAITGAPELPGTIEFLKERIKRSKEDIPKHLSELREERRQLVRQIHLEILEIRKTYETLYAPVQKIATVATTSADSLQLEFDAYLSTSGFDDNFLDFIRKNRKGTFQGEEESKKAVIDLIQAHDFNSTESTVAFTDAVYEALTGYDKDGKREPVTIDSQLRQAKRVVDLYNFVFGLGYLDTRYTLRLSGKDISQLSPGEKGALLLVFYLLLDTEEIPIIIDQPEHNLDNESVVRLLVDCIRAARSRRQVIIVTHNPNLAVYCDADQLIYCSIDKSDGHKIEYTTGAIEESRINVRAVNVLEGTYPAFDNRRKKYHKPQIEIAEESVSHDPLAGLGL